MIPSVPVVLSVIVCLLFPVFLALSVIYSVPAVPSGTCSAVLLVLARTLLVALYMCFSVLTFNVYIIALTPTYFLMLKLSRITNCCIFFL